MQDNLSATFSDLERKWNGTYSVQVEVLTDGRSFSLREREKRPTASTGKLFILCELFRQAAEEELDLNQEGAWDDDHVRGGDGLLKAMRQGQTLSLYNLAVLMMTVSDNTATQVLLEQVTPEKVNAFLADNGLGDSWMPPVWPSGRQGERVHPQSTAHDLCELAARLYREQILTPDACQQIIRIMRFNRDNDMMPRYIPFGEDHLASRERWTAHKQGYGPCRVEAGLIHEPERTIAVGISYEPNEPVGSVAKSLADYPPVLAVAEACKAIYDSVFTDTP